MRNVKVIFNYSSVGNIAHIKRLVVCNRLCVINQIITNDHHKKERYVTRLFHSVKNTLRNILNLTLQIGTFSYLFNHCTLKVLYNSYHSHNKLQYIV